MDMPQFSPEEIHEEIVLLDFIDRNEKYEAFKAMRREYTQRPEVKMKRKERESQPDVKAKIQEYGHEYSQREHVIARRQAKYYTPEEQARLNEYKQRPEVKSRRKMYYKEYNVDTNEKYAEVQRKWKESEAGQESMKKASTKFAKTNKRKEYLYAYRRTEKAKQYRRAFEKIYKPARIKSDIGFSIGVRLRKSLGRVLKNYAAGKRMSSKQYGIDYREIAKYLGPKPDNIQDWVIDHIRPCCSFDLTDLEQIRMCFAPQNLRWLTAEENARKIVEDKKISLRARRNYHA